jgi:long-chain acyl-CoA synthetase
VRAEFTAKFDRELVSTYGLTEAPSVVAIDPPAGGSAPDQSGLVLPHLRIVVEATTLDDDDDEGGGELCLAAATEGPYAGLYRPMLSYLDDPGETQAALRNGVVHTGDLGRVSPDGHLTVRDRRKLVIMRGGANVYPAEVESVIRTFPGVRAVAVTGVADDRLGARVGAVVEDEDDRRRGDQSALRARAGRYKVPER